VTDTSLFALLAAIVGAMVGSFLNVCIHRLPRGESIVHPRSRCPHCGHQIAWFENVPVVSWVVLGARCRKCRARISPMYPIVELTTALLFAACAVAFGPTLLFLSRAIFVAAMLTLAITDLRERILPNAITYPGVIVGLLFSLVLPPGIVSALVGAVAGAAVPWLIGELYYRVRRIEGLGMGDVKMLAMIGAFLGWQMALVTLFAGSLLGVLVGVPITVIKRDRYYMIPLGTFLAIGAVAATFVGPPLVEWYMGLYP
jgi:leader peptidase (prepilin peptidase)/N-methyltransferase